MARRWWRRVLAIAAGLVVIAIAGVAVIAPNLFELLVAGDDRDLRAGPEAPATASDPAVLILALDGVDRRLLYDLLEAGELPELAATLGGKERSLERAYLDDTALAPMPTSTLASWATIFTGVPPGTHGVAGNEYFVRDKRAFIAPAPVSIDAPDLVLQTYTDGYVNELLAVPTLYERLRARGRPLSIWVAMSQFFRGADRLIVADRSVLGDAFAAFIDDDDDADDLELYAALDRKVIENVVQALETSTPPHVLTVYLTGADHFAHSSEEGPDRARRRYLRDVFEPLMRTLRVALERRGALSNRYVVVVSDHGHTAVRHDAEHALALDDTSDPPAVVRAAGFRLRPFELDAGDAAFDTVLAYGGALAYAYVADRSTCARSGGCDWARPPRFDADVLPLAEAFHAASARGDLVPAMRGTLDLVLVRRADGELHEYVGGGRTRPIEERPGYVALRERLRELAVGDRGEHAGDIVLIARNGAEPDVGSRYYFSKRYYSWHGSPSAADSQIPFIVAHPQRSRRELARLVRRVAGERTDATDITPIIEQLLAK